MPTPGAPSHDCLPFDVCEIDLDSVEIRVRGDVVPVQPQVFAVIEYLIAHRDRVVTKGELLDNVWGDRFVGEATLSSRIKSARRALGDNGERQTVIKTVHGRGYRFVAPVKIADRRPTESVEHSSACPVGTAGTPVTGDADWPLVGRYDELELVQTMADVWGRQRRADHRTRWCRQDPTRRRVRWMAGIE